MDVIFFQIRQETETQKHNLLFTILKTNKYNFTLNKSLLSLISVTFSFPGSCISTFPTALGQSMLAGKRIPSFSILDDKRMEKLKDLFSQDK